MALLLWLAGQFCYADATIAANITGEQLMKQVYERHQQFPYIYEEQSLIMEDRNGDRDTRRAKRYTRVEEDGSIKFLLLFDYPEEIRGVALLAERHPDGRSTRHVYLPALGETMTETIGGARESNFLGTDFSVEDLTGEDLSRYHYIRRNDRVIDGIGFHLVDVYEKKVALSQKKGDGYADRSHTDESNLHKTALRRHFIRQDSLFITLTHHYDRLGRISRIQSWHDLRPVAGDMWRADMILMVDKKEKHQSLIKVSRRIYSRDYVPEEVFSPDWLFRQYPYVEPVIDEAEDEMSLEELSIEELTLEELALPLAQREPIQ